MAKKKKPPSIQELLLNEDKDNLGIWQELQDWVDDADAEVKKKLLHNSAIRDALVTRLKQGCAACRDILNSEDASSYSQELRQHLSAMGSLAALVPFEPGSKLARLLLHGSDLLAAVAETLGCINDLCIQCCSWDRTPAADSILDATQQTGRTILAAVQDMDSYTYPAMTSMQATQAQFSQRGTQGTEASGRDVCGPALLRSILDLAGMDVSLSGRVYSLRRAAASALRDLVTQCRRNQLLLLDAANSQAYSILMGQVLPGCGDQPTQIELLEVMYRCAKVLGDKVYHSYLDAQVRGLFAELLAKDSATLDLDDELLDLAAAYNTSLGEAASVVHVLAEQLKIHSPLPDLQPEGREATIGLGHLSLMVVLDDPLAENEQYDEILDIDFSNITRVVVSARRTAAADNPNMPKLYVADFQCTVFPTCLGADVVGAAEALARGAPPVFKLGMLLQESQLNRLLLVLKTHGILVVNMSSGLMEPSQPEHRPRKVSLGNLPSSYTKQPLAFTKATPMSSNRTAPLQLFKTPQTGAAKAAGAAAADAAAAPAGEAASDAEAAVPAAAAAADRPAVPAAPLESTTPEMQQAPAADVAGRDAGPRVAGHDSQMLDALLATVEQLPSKHAGGRPAASDSPLNGQTDAAAADGADTAAGGAGQPAAGKATAPAQQMDAPAAAAAAGVGDGTAGVRAPQQRSKQQKQQQHKKREEEGGSDGSVSWDEDGEAVGRVETIPKGTTSADAAAVKEEKGLGVASRGRDKAAATADPVTKPAAAQEAAAADATGKPVAAANRTAAGKKAPPPPPPPAAAAVPAGKPPPGRGKKAAAQKATAADLPKLTTTTRSRRAASPNRKGTQDSIQDPDLPSLPPAPQPGSADMPTWMAGQGAAGQGAAVGTSAAAAAARATTPYSSRKAAKAAAAADIAAATGAEGAAAATPIGAGRKKASRLTGMQATTPKDKGKPLPKPAGAPHSGAAAAAAAAAAGGNVDEGPTARQAVTQVFPEDDAAGAGAEEAGRAAQRQHAAKTKDAAAAAKKAAGHPAQGPTSSADAAPNAPQQPQLSDFDFQADGSDDDDADAKGAMEAAKAGKGTKAGKGAAAKPKPKPKAAGGKQGPGVKRKAAPAAAAAQQQKGKLPPPQQQLQQRRQHKTAVDTDPSADQLPRSKVQVDGQKGLLQELDEPISSGAAAAGAHGDEIFIAESMPPELQLQLETEAEDQDAWADADAEAGEQQGPPAAKKPRQQAAVKHQQEVQKQQEKGSSFLQPLTGLPAAAATDAAAAGGRGGVKTKQQQAGVKKAPAKQQQQRKGPAAAAAAPAQPRAARSSKIKAMQAMQQQLKETEATQPDAQNLTPTQPDEAEEAPAAPAARRRANQQQLRLQLEGQAGLLADEGDGGAAGFEPTELEGGLGSPDAHSGSGGAAAELDSQGIESPASEDDLGDLTRLQGAMQAAKQQAGRPNTAAAAVKAAAGLEALLQGAAAPTEETPDTLKIDTAKVVRKLAFQAGKTAGTTGQRRATARTPAASLVAAAGAGGGGPAGLGSFRQRSSSLLAPLPLGNTAPPASRGAAGVQAAGGVGGGGLRLPGLGLHGLGGLADMDGFADAEGLMERNAHRAAAAAAAAAGPGRSRRPAPTAAAAAKQLPTSLAAAAAALGLGGSAGDDDDEGDEAGAADQALLLTKLGGTGLGLSLGRQQHFGGQHGAAAAAGGGRRRLAAAAEEEEEIGPDSQGDEIAMVAQIISAALKDPGEAEEQDESDNEELELLQASLIRAMTAKKTAAKKKREREIRELEERLLVRMNEFEAVCAHDYAQLAATGKAQLSALQALLDDKAAALQALGDRFQEELAHGWAEYREVYGQMAALQEDLRRAEQKKTASHKRKLAAMQQEFGSIVADAERNMARKRSHVEGRLPGIANMLQAALEMGSG